MNVAEVLAEPLSQESLDSHIPAWFAYTGVDGDPGVGRQLNKQMVTITVTPDWAELLDFVTTLPKAVEELVKAYGDPR